MSYYIKSILLSGDRNKLAKTVDYFARWYNGLQLYSIHRLLDELCRQANPHMSLEHIDTNIRHYALRSLKAAETKRYVKRQGEGVSFLIPVDTQSMSSVAIGIAPLSTPDAVSLRFEWPCESNYEIARLLSFMMFTQKLDDYLVFINDNYATHYTVRQVNAILSAEIAGFDGIVFIDMIQGDWK